MHNLYVISSDSKTKLDDKVNQIIAQHEGLDCDILHHDLDDTSLSSLLEEVNTIPFLNEHKIVIMKNAKFLYKIDMVDEKIVDAFIKYLYHPVSTTTLIVLLDSLKGLDKTIKKAFDENAIVEELTTLRDIDVKEYIKSTLEEKSFQYDERIIEELVFRTKGNFERIELELDKLMLYKYNDKMITLQDVKLQISKDLEDNVFDLINAIIDNDKTKAINIYKDLMVLNEDPARIISMLISKFNELYQVKALTEKGMSKNDIADIFKVKPGKIYYTQKACQNINIRTLKNKINDLVETDYKIKSGQLDKNIALEMFILK